jgi:hypothetical protein
MLSVYATGTIECSRTKFILLSCGQDPLLIVIPSFKCSAFIQDQRSLELSFISPK